MGKGTTGSPILAPFPSSPAPLPQSGPLWRWSQVPPPRRRADSVVDVLQHVGGQSSPFVCHSGAERLVAAAPHVLRVE